jgi:hypothetical protein
MIYITDGDYNLLHQDGDDGSDINSPYDFSAYLVSGVNWVLVGCSNVNSGNFTNGVDSSSTLGLEFAKQEKVLKP